MPEMKYWMRQDKLMEASEGRWQVIQVIPRPLVPKMLPASLPDPPLARPGPLEKLGRRLDTQLRANFTIFRASFHVHPKFPPVRASSTPISLDSNIGGSFAQGEMLVPICLSPTWLLAHHLRDPTAQE